MSESAKELSSKRGDIILGPFGASVPDGRFVSGSNVKRTDSVVEAGKSYIITFNSDDSEWADMPLYITPGNIRIPLKQFNSNTYIVKFTATGTETAIGIANLGSGRPLSYTNYTVHEYKEPDNVLRPFIADKMYYRNQEVQRLYLGSQLVWSLQPAPEGKELQKYVGHPNGEDWKVMKVGDKVTIRKGATKWLNKNFAQMEPMQKDYTGKTATVERVADVKIDYSNKAYYLKNMKVWILEQDLVEPRQA